MASSSAATSTKLRALLPCFESTNSFPGKDVGSVVSIGRTTPSHKSIVNDVLLTILELAPKTCSRISSMFSTADRIPSAAALPATVASIICNLINAVSASLSPCFVAIWRWCAACFRRPSSNICCSSIPSQNPTHSSIDSKTMSHCRDDTMTSDFLSIVEDKDSFVTSPDIIVSSSFPSFIFVIFFSRCKISISGAFLFSSGLYLAIVRLCFRYKLPVS
mmetsp:Transcript_1274/g.1427  ORF Transcript_1274/g.1427 Transcript_1274/m.1427 type:complete len:219 (-) Transcript_1274:121-777(-)